MRLRRTLASFALVALPSTVACGGQEFVAGTSDAAAVTPDAGLGFCASQPAGQYALCSDFDEKPLPENWNDLLTNGGPPVAEDDSTSVSPPNSLLAAAPALAAGATATQAFVTTTSLPKGAVHIAFEMRIDALSFPSNATGATIVPALYTQGKYEILLAFAPSMTGPFAFVLAEVSEPTVSALDAGGGSAFHDLTPLFAHAGDGGSVLGAWQEIKIDLNIDKGQKTATVTVGSVSEVVTLTLTPPVGTANGDRSFSIGVQASAPAGETKIRFDNVTYAGG